MPFTGQGTGIQNANDVFLSGIASQNVLRYNATTSKWNNIPYANSVTTLALTNLSVTAPKLAASNSPAAGQVLAWDGTAMIWTTPVQSTGGSQTFSYSGSLQTGSGVNRLFNDSGVSRTITSVRISVGTAPTGANILVDVNIAGVSIFTNQANRPSISANTLVGSLVSTSVTWPDSKALTIDVDQVGSATAGSDLTVTVEYN